MYKEVVVSNVYQYDIIRAFPTYLEHKYNVKFSKDKSKYKVEIGKFIKSHPGVRDEIIDYIKSVFKKIFIKYDDFKIYRFYVDEIITNINLTPNLGDESIITFDIFKIKKRKINIYVHSKLIRGFIKIYYDNSLKIDKKTLLPFGKDIILDIYNTIGDKQLIFEKYLDGRYEPNNYITNIGHIRGIKLNNLILEYNKHTFSSNILKNIDKEYYYNTLFLYNLLLTR